MEANGKTSKTGEISMTENKTGNVVLTISEEVEASKNPTLGTPKDSKPRGVSSMESPHRKSDDISPENAHFMPNPNKPPKTPNPETLTRLNSLAALVYSKPKSRFGEQPIIAPNMFDDMPEPVGQTSNSSPSGTPSKGTPRSLSIDPKTPLMGSPKTPLMGSPRGDDDDDYDDDKEIYNKVNIEKQLKHKRVKMKILFHGVLLLFLVGCIVASITTSKLKNYKICTVKLWKWFVLITVIIYGMLVTDWLIRFIILLIELNFMMKKKVFYYVHGLKKSVQVCIWFIGILVTWELLFKPQNAVKSKTTTKVFDYLTWTIVALLIGSVLWVLKNLLLKILPTSFHVRNFFDRIRESIFLQYVLETLSGPPVMESLPNVSKVPKREIDILRLQTIKKEKVSTWTMRMLSDTITNRGLSTFSGEFEESAYYGSGVDKEITSEMEAIAAAYHIFRNVAGYGLRYIEDIDLRRFMIKEEVDIVFPMIDVGDKGKIDRRTLTEWVVKVYNKRKALAHALDDTKTAVNELNKLVSAVLIVIMIIVWLLLTEIATTKVLVLISSQLVVAAFIFGNTCKTVFEAIIFVFIMHPFDVGDRCVVDGVQMVVEEMNILGTVFLKFDNEMIYYPNSVLATKPVSNFYRSPDMGDNVEFYIDFATPFEKIELLKNKIRKYLKKNPQLWYANHNFVVKEIENENKIKMALLFNHKMNFQDYSEKNKRRGELILELKKTFEELKIKCYLLPQEVHISNPETPTPTPSGPTN